MPALGAAPVATPGGPRLADSSAPGPLLRLIEASGTGRRRLEARIEEAHATLERLERGLGSARDELDTRSGHERRAEEEVAEVRAQLAELEPELARLAATPLTVAAARRTTPVAYPLPKGQKLEDRTTRAAQELAAARGRREQLTAHLTDSQERLSRARAAGAAAELVLTAKTEEVEEQRRILGRLDEQLAQEPGPGLPEALARALSSAGGPAAPPSALAVSDIPADWLERYVRAAGRCPGMSWTVLAAVGSIESSHGRSSAPGVHSEANFAGAMGPMQFLAGTWDAYAADGDSDGDSDVYDPEDAVFGAANYLCASGAGDLGRLGDAIWAYNHADWYVEAVLQRAAAYGSGMAATTAADAAELADNTNVTLSPQARADLLGGGVDPRVVTVLALAAGRHQLEVSVIRTGHDQFVRGTDRVSNHYFARAVDISAVDGAAVSASNVAALELSLALLSLGRDLRPSELGSPWPELGQFSGSFTDGDHLDHLHLGWVL